jgi:hypothetical protein
MWTDILDIQFPDAEDRNDSQNVDLFAFQRSAAARSIFLPPFHS